MLQGLRKLREVAKLKCYAGHLEQKHKELELAMMGTPVSWVVDLVSAVVHRAIGLAPSSPGAPSPSVEGQWTPSPLGPSPKRAHCALTTTISAVTMEEVMLQEVPLPTGSFEAISGPLESSQLLMVL